jgi:hypothetical protein
MESNHSLSSEHLIRVHLTTVVLRSIARMELAGRAYAVLP